MFLESSASGQAAGCSTFGPPNHQVKYMMYKLLGVNVRDTQSPGGEVKES